MRAMALARIHGRRPSAVEAQVNGFSFDLPRGRQPVHDLVIDLDTLKALKDKHEAL